MAPPKTSSTKLDTLAALNRLHFDAAYAELTVATGLFFMLAFDVGFAANGFAVWTLGGLRVRSTW